MISQTGPSDAVVPLSNSGRTRTLALLLVLTGLFFVWWRQGMPIPLSQRPTAPRFVAQPRPHFPTEEEWIVGQISQQIAETAGFAKAGKGPGVLRLHVKTTRQWPTREKPEHYQFQTVMRGKELSSMEVDLTNYLWDPENFTPLARQLLGVVPNALPFPRTTADREIFQRLIHPSSEVLVKEDKRLSAALTEHPLDPEIHEEAALLIGSFALRHAAGCFYDLRRELSSMSAHLALARALDKNAGPSGELAEAILCTLSGRQNAAFEILQRLDRHRDTDAGLPLEANTVWSRALTIRNTGDYRRLDQPEHASLLERLEYVRALRYSVNSAAASSFLVRFPAERLAEWSNLVLIWPFSVEEGHFWVPHALANELDEAATQYRAYTGKRLDNDSITTALNTHADHVPEGPDHTAHIEVLGWGMWASFHQRQLCELLETTWAWMDNQWGVPKEAAKFKEMVTKEFSRLELFPLVEMEKDEERASGSAVAALRAKFWQDKPELVPFSFWNNPSSRLQQATAKSPPKLPWNAWFPLTFPFGTLYDANFREEIILPRLSQTDLDKLKAEAPYNTRVLYFQMQRAWRNTPTPEQMTAQFEPVSGYDLWSMELLANAVSADPDRYEAAFTPVCRLEPNRYRHLGQYLREHNRPDAAAKAYQKAVDYAPDRVGVSNDVEWLVEYYYTHNRQTDAFAVAEMAAKVYSARGLITMAKLCERAGRLFDAESYFRKEAERYDSWTDLAIFYARHPKEPKFAGAVEPLLRKIFPDGEEPAKADEMIGTPEDGVALSTTSKTMQSLGLQQGDKVVAINGVRVRTNDQYFYKMESAPSPKIELLVWSKRAYRTITANLPTRSLRD